MAPGEAGQFMWLRELSSSRSSGDALLTLDAGNHYYYSRQAANAAPGVWTLSGTPVAAVPEPVTGALWLAGLGMLGAWRRRILKSPARRLHHAFAITTEGRSGPAAIAANGGGPGRCHLQLHRQSV
jgi:hypothetical protein